jgi:L-serine dehydratase
MKRVIFLNAFDIIGPDMIGPSSSHTAGAARIGKAASAILGGKPVKARIGFYGSFFKTGTGHGTHKAIIAGILGMKPNDVRIRNSLDIAKKSGLIYEFYEADLDKAHPNTAVIDLENDKGKKIHIEAASIGGGKVQITKIDQMPVNVEGEYTTILILNDDRPGVVASVSGILAKDRINIATFELHRNKKGKFALMSINIDNKLTDEELSTLKELPGVKEVRVLKLGTI